MARRLLVGLVAVLAIVACTSDSGTDPKPAPTQDTEQSTTTSPPRGGTARVAVWEEPDPTRPTITGAGVRALVQPQLFRATPDGNWEPWLVEPASITEADDHRSVSFRLREARWSNGEEIGPADLARGGDESVIEEISANPEGLVTVKFSQPLPGWRGLWSGARAVSPPAPDVYGGPFVVTSAERGLRTVLERNDDWWGEPPLLDRLELIVVPDDHTASQLLERDELDVVMPRAATGRISGYEAMDDVVVDTGDKGDKGDKGGWWFGAETSPDVEVEQRKAILSLIDEKTFVGTLLDGEATVLDGFGAAPDVWAEPIAGDPAVLDGSEIDVLFAETDPVAGLLHRVIARTAPGTSRVDRIAVDADASAEFAAAGTFDVRFDWFVDDPDLCNRCRFAHIDVALSMLADSGDTSAQRSLFERSRDEALLLPMWTPTPMVAHRQRLVGPEANGYARIAAWNAETWFVSP